MPVTPWTTVDSREVYRNQWLHVREDAVIRPDGTPGIYGVVAPADNAATVAIDDRGRVVLLDEFIYPLGVVSRQIPSGGMNPGESPLEAAKRELLEETGVIAAEWTPLGACYLSGGISTQISHLFVARDIVRTRPRPEGTERLKQRWTDLRDAVRWAQEGRIMDAPSVAALFRAWHRLQHDLESR